MRRVFVVLAIFLAACGRGSAPAPVPPPETGDARVDQFLSSRRQPAATKASTRVRAGDTLRIAVDGVVEVSGEYTVGKDGKIRLPFADEAKVAGKTLRGATLAIARSLQSVAKDPEVEVTLVERTAGEVEIVGAVKRPGSVGIGLAGRSIAEALEYAGGLGDDASGTVRLVPGMGAAKGNAAEAVVSADEAVEFSSADVAADGPFGGLYLRPGDRIEVAARQAIAAAEVPDTAPQPPPSLREDEPTAPVEDEIVEAPLPETEPAPIAEARPPEVGAPPVPAPLPVAPSAAEVRSAARADAEATAALARDVARQRAASEREIAASQDKIATLEAEIEKERATSEVLRARVAVLEAERRRPAAEPPSAPVPPPNVSSRRSIEERVPLEREGRELVVSERRTEVSRANAPVVTRPALASSSVAIEGMVAKPGEYPIAEARSVRRAVALAGIVAGAKLSAVEVIRANEAGESHIEVNLAEVSAGRSPDLLLEGGDRVVVPEQR